MIYSGLTWLIEREKTMRVIITGGSGLIGSALARGLVQENHEVIVLTRKATRATGLPASVQLVEWDGRSAAGWGSLADGADAIVNLAGASIAGESFLALILKRWTPAFLKKVLDSRLNAGKAVLEAIQAARVKPKVLIQASAVGYYGDRGDEFLTEESAPANDALAEICKQWEASTAPAEQMGVRRIVIRTGGMALSTKGGTFPYMMLPFKFFVGGPLGSGKNWFSWIHIADEVGAIRFLIDNPDARGVFNLSSPQTLTNREFSHVMGRVMKRPSFFPLPAFVLRLMFGAKASILLGSQRQIPERLQKMGYQFQFPDAELALRDIMKKRIAMQYHHTFRVASSRAAVSAFHTDASSLSAITPPPVLVRVNQAPPRLTEGDIMDFTMWLGPLPVHWVARIEQVSPSGFTDRQMQGPFQSWVHRHNFIPVDDRTTEVVDGIQFELKPQLWWRLIGGFLGFTLPLLFAFRSWKTRRLLA